MSQIGSALRTFALSSSAIDDAIGDRMSPGHRPQGEPGDGAAVTYQIITSTPDESLTGDARHETARIQFDVYDNDEDNADAVARQLRLRLLQAFGTLPVSDADDAAELFVTGVSTAGGVRHSSNQAPIDASDDWLYRVGFDLTVSFNPPS
ncbi:hypothetical protein V7x_28810 [Crateriforma conspicua]|uniref:Uncharacterized protein n=1 Tax=Crateriforma conspicua TaxID=2527996 RepID=A0A5C6FWE4_9PLAN|nr:hypothetical protein [Crateriforma conspicua]TWU67307.1 hypothetical protein V7x_28810 [Crateriforma conspicua]